MPLSPELTRLASLAPSHRFLTNPSAQCIYIYLARFVIDLSLAWTGKSRSDLQILDWGCGKGHFSFLLKEQGVAPTSCDRVSSSDDSSFGQDTPIVAGAKIPVVPLDHDYLLPFDDASFDVVLSVGVLEHVPSDVDSLRELRRILRPRGLLFCFFLPYTLSWSQRLSHVLGDHYHDRLYAKRHVRSLLAATGFDIVDLWHRQLLPKNSIRYPAFRTVERTDQFLTEFTPLGLLATNIEFVATARA